MKVLVSGATGTVGRHIVEQLLRAGASVRALTRDPHKARFADEVEVVSGDLTAPQTLVPALEGVDALHLITFGGDDYAELETGDEIVALARKAGVRRVTVLMGGESGSVDRAVRASDLEWTFLRPVEFMSGALDWAGSIRDEGVVRDGFSNRRSAMIHEADIGAVAATALLEDGHAGKTYTLTGPEVLTPPELVRTIGAAIGRPISYVELTEEQAREQWRAAGFPPEHIEFFVMVHGNTPPEGYTVLPTVEQVTGRPARTFAQWAAENAAAFGSQRSTQCCED